MECIFFFTCRCSADLPLCLFPLRDKQVYSTVTVVISTTHGLLLFLSYYFCMVVHEFYIVEQKCGLWYHPKFIVLTVVPPTYLMLLFAFSGSEPLHAG